MSLSRRAGVLCAVLSTPFLLLPAGTAEAQILLSEAKGTAVTAPTAAGDTANVATVVPVLRLDELLEAVRANNPTLRAALLEADALETKEAQVSSLPDPVVMGSYQPYSVLTGRGAQRSQWRVEQMVPFPGKLGLQADIAVLSAEVAGYEAETFSQDLLVQVKITYYELYRLQEQILHVEAFQERLRSFEDVATTQYEVGIGPQQAILKAQLEKNTLSQRRIDLSRRRTTAIETLSRLINESIAASVEVRVAPPGLLSADVEQLVEIARRERPEEDALASAMTRAEVQVALAEKQFLPDFGFSITYFDIASRQVPATADGRDALGLGISVKVPLWRKRLRAHVEETQVRVAQVTARQEALATSYRTQISDLLSQLQREAEQLTLFRGVLIPQAETTLESTLSAYTTARTDFLNLLDAERMLFTLQMGYEDALARYLQASARLERALGIRTLDEIERP